MIQRIIDRSYVGEVLQHMYESDLDITISLISRDGYFYIATYDKRISLQGTTIEEAVTHFAFKLIKKFPASKFDLPVGGWIIFVRKNIDVSDTDIESTPRAEYDSILDLNILRAYKFKPEQYEHSFK